MKPGSPIRDGFDWEKCHGFYLREWGVTTTGGGTTTTTVDRDMRHSGGGGISTGQVSTKCLILLYVMTAVSDYDI